MPSASLGDSPRSASISDSGCIQITASALGFSAYDILHAPLKSKSVSYKPPALLYASTAGLLKSYILSVLLGLWILGMGT